MKRDEGSTRINPGRGSDFDPSPETSGTTAEDGSRFDLDYTKLDSESTFIRVQRASTTSISTPQHS